MLYYKLKRKKEFDFSNVFCLMNLTYFIQDSGSEFARWRHLDVYSARLFKSEKGTFGVDLYTYIYIYTQMLVILVIKDAHFDLFN